MTAGPSTRAGVTLAHRVVRLRMRGRFGLSRGSFRSVQVVQVAVSARGVTGYGEGAPVPRHGETAETAQAFLEEARPLLGDGPLALEDMDRRLAVLPGEMAARCALDAAVHDLLGKLAGQPVWRMLGLPRRGPPCSYTLSLAAPEAMARAAAATEGRFRRLKLKLGGRDGLDLERVRAVRAVTRLPLQVDVNEYWSLAEALEAIPQLAALGVECVEQPLPAGDEGAPQLRDGSPLPIFLDEECGGADDVAACAARGHGVNVKLSKAGGIRGALRAIDAARSRGLAVMLGCMVESSLGIAAACQVAGLCDYADLDGNLLIARDRWRGVELVEGVQTPADAPGLGVAPAGRRR